MGVQITPRKPNNASDTGNWLARIQVRFRDNPQLYKAPDGARCGKIGSLEKPFFLCFMSGDFNGSFNIDRTGNDLKLYMAGSNHDFVVVPGTDKSAFVRVSPQNPEHAVFLLRPTPAAACEQDLK